MAEWFKNFVESSTGATYIPTGSGCSLCGKKLGFLSTGFFSCNAVHLLDGALCKDCEEKLLLLLSHKGQCLPRHLQEQAPYCTMDGAGLGGITKENATLFLEQCNTYAKEIMTAQGAYTGLFRTEKARRIRPKSTEVGVARAKLLRDRVVLYGFVQTGQFKKGDSVRITDGVQVLETEILEVYVYDCEENTLDVNLKANMGKHRLNTWQKGWLVLDTEKLISAIPMAFV